MNVSRDFGIVVHRAALAAKDVDLTAIMAEFNFQTYLDETDSLISLGPFFGGDAADECIRSLEALGLAYVDNFFCLCGVCARLVFIRSFLIHTYKRILSAGPHRDVVSRHRVLRRHLMSNASGLAEHRKEED